jgi:uncharacterized protein YbjT (DUF2867 family)
VRAPSGLMQPVAVDDVVAALAELAVAPPSGATPEVAGPEAFAMNAILRRYLADVGDPRPVVDDETARYFGALIDEKSLVPLADFRAGAITYERWRAGR